MSYDFRHHACPTDPLSGRFGEWVDYYRFKHDLAACLQPATILEVGVRYGYSAAAFLDGAPGSAYLGIDTDDGTWGGVTGALDHARALVGNRGSVVVGDGLHPAWWGQDWSLVHLDGPQDEASWDTLISLALPRATFVLLDGTDHSPSNRAVASRWREQAVLDTHQGYGQMLLKGAA